MMASPATLALAIRLLFFAYLLFQDKTIVDRTTIQLGTELLYFAGTLAQSLTHLLWALIGPPVTRRRRMLRTTVGIIYPLNVNLIIILRFLEKVLEEGRDTDDTTLCAVFYAKIMSLSLVYLCFGLVLANRIADLGNEQLRHITMPAWEIVDVMFFLSISMWSLAAFKGIMAAIRIHILGGPLLESELEEFMDWTLYLRETLGWIYYIRMTFMEVFEHEFVLRGEVGPDFPE